MTDDRMALQALLERHGESDVIRDTLEFVLQRLMELEAEIRCGAGKHERSEDRTNQRNGYRPRSRITLLQGHLCHPCPSPRRQSRPGRWHTRRCSGP